MKALADLHASSLILRANNLEQWESLTCELNDIRMSTNTYNVWLEISLKTAIEELRTIEENAAEILASSPPKATIQSSNTVFQVTCQ